MSKERRRSPRIPQRVPCEIRLGRERFSAYLLDLSEGGLGAVGTEELPLGSSAEVSFRALGQSLDVTAMIWHSRQVRFQGKRAWAYGLMIESPSPQYVGMLPRRAKRKNAPATGPAPKPDVPPQRVAPADPGPAPEPAPASAEDDARDALEESLRHSREETQPTSYRVRAKKRDQPRTKTLTLSVASADEARAAVEDRLGDEWEILDVEAA